MAEETENPAEHTSQSPAKKFNQEHWEEALAAVFAKAAVNGRFRHLCLTNPRAAVHEVDPGLELPEDFDVVFVSQSKDLVHSYLLPTPLITPDLFDERQLLKYTKEAIESYTNNWTGTSTPKGTGSNCGNQGGGGKGGGGNVGGTP